MITEKELQQAIDDCLKEPITGQKRTALADLIIIQDYLFGEPPPMQMASYSPPPDPTDGIISVEGGSEFLSAVDGRKADRVWRLMDEMIEAVKVLHPRMYARFIEKIMDI